MKKTILGMALTLGMASSAFAGDMMKKDIVDTAVGAGQFNTLVAAVQAAKIEHILVNAGPLTVFAPVNSAFDALPAVRLGRVTTASARALGVIPKSKDVLATTSAASAN